MSDLEEELPVEPTADQLRTRINEALATVAEEDREIEFNKLRMETILAVLKADLARLIEPHQAVRDAHVDGIVNDFLRLMEMGEVRGKSLALPNGTVLVRTGKEALVITDEKGAMNWLRRNRLLGRTTRLVRVIDKTKTKEALKTLPDYLVARFAKFAHLQTTTRVSVKPVTMQTELARELDPHQRAIADAESS